MNNDVKNFFQKGVHLELFATFEKDYNETYNTFLKAPKTVIGDQKLHELFYEYMRTADSFGFHFENNGDDENALFFYTHARKYLNLAYALVWSNDANHHLAICDLTLARIHLSQNKFSDFTLEYTKFLEHAVASFSATTSSHDPLFYLRKHTRELFEKANIIDKVVFNDLFKLSLMKYQELYETGLINEVELQTLQVGIYYLYIIFEIDTRSEIFLAHINKINALRNAYGDENGLKLVHEQFDKLIHASFVPPKFKDNYLSFKETLFKSAALYDNKIRVFISSVFRDFQDERDIISELVVPAMQEYCTNEYGLEFEVIDLRWGIELNKYLTEFETTYKVLSVCGEMIEKAKPYFLLFLSNEYGSEVSPALVNQIYPFLNVDTTLSITELEYLLRIYKNENLQSIFLFIKDREKIKDTRVLSFMDNVIQEIPQSNVIEYDAKSNALAAEIIKTLKAAIAQSHKQVVIHDDIEFKMERAASKMIGFSNELEQALTLIKEENRLLFAIHSTPGGGKSTFLSKVYAKAQQHNYYTFAFLTKDYDREVSEYELILFIKESLEAHLELESYTTKQTTISELLSIVKDLVKKLEENTRIIFFIDDYDVLLAHGEPLAWLTKDFLPLQFVVSVTASNVFMRLIAIGAIPLQLNGLSSDDFELYVTRKFGEHFKVVDPDIITRLYLKFTKPKLAINPLYLNALINELIYIDASEYASIYAQIAGNSVDFAKAITNHQRQLIRDFPAKLEDYAEKVLNAYAAKSNENKLILALLAFTYLGGLKIEQFNSILKRANIKRSLPSFIDLKFDLGHLIEVSDINYAKIAYQFVVEAIVKIIPDDMMKFAGALIVNSKEMFTLAPLVRAYVYFGEYDYLAQIFKRDGLLKAATITDTLAKHPFGKDYLSDYIAQVSISQQSLELFHHLYTNNIKVSHISYGESFTLLSKMLERLKDELPTHEIPDLIYDYYAIFGKEQLELIPEERAEKEFRNHYDFIQAQFNNLEFNNPYLINYFTTFIEKLKEAHFDANTLLNDFIDMALVGFNTTRVTWIDAQFAYIKFIERIGGVIGQNEIHPLDAFIDLYTQVYKGEFVPAKLETQIDLLYFIAETSNNLERDDAFNYYTTLYNALTHPALIFPKTTKLIKIHATVTNNLAAMYVTNYLYKFYEDPLYFDRTDEEFTNQIAYVENLILDTVFAAQTTFNGAPSNKTLFNLNVSNLNYSIFYGTFLKEPHKAINNLSATIVNATHYFASRIFDHQGIINALLYNQIFLDYYNIKKYDALHVLSLYRSELAKYNPKRVKLDANDIFSFTNSHLKVMHIEKSATYLELEKAVSDFINYLARLPLS